MNKNITHSTYISLSIISPCSGYNEIKCPDAYLLVGILTRPEQLYERIITRKIVKNYKFIKHFFITGLHEDRIISSRLYKENKIFKDILIFNILSSYYNCSAIMICFYIYLEKHCKNVAWIAKLDIDTYINITTIYNLTKKCNKNISVIGSINVNPRLKCNANSIWYVGCGKKSGINSITPPYPYGPAFVFRLSSLPCIKSYVNRNNKIIWIEDAFFGILMGYCKLKYLDIQDKAVVHGFKLCSYAI